MKVIDCIDKGEFVTIVELLPPKELNIDKLERYVSSIQGITRFVSLTSKKEAYAITSLDAASALGMRGAIETDFIAHITLIEFGEIRELPYIRLKSAAQFGVRNLLVMRGDGEFSGGGYRYACVLVETIHNMNAGIDPRGQKCEPTDFCIGAVISQYRDRKEEFNAAREKRRCGAEYFITQMCFDPFCTGQYPQHSYEAFCRDLYDHLGERVPVIAGVPIPDKSTIGFIHDKQGEDPIFMPDTLEERIHNCENDRDERITIAREILAYLRDATDAPGVDIFSIGNVKLARRVLGAE
jgi:5,10-methylenetetrahydrofolate reductase